MNSVYVTSFIKSRQTDRQTKQNSPIDNGIVVMAPDLETIMVTWRDVTQYVYLLSSHFSPLELVNKPLELLGWVSGVE